MESKTYVFNPESGTSGTGSNGILAMLPALMQRQGVDPGLIALLNNRGNGNGWGEDIFAILLLFILMGNNGMGLFGGNRCMGFSSLQAANRVLTMGQIEKSVPLKEKENVSRTKTVFSLLHLRQGRRKADSKNRSSNIGQQSSAEIS